MTVRVVQLSHYESFIFQLMGGKSIKFSPVMPVLIDYLLFLGQTAAENPLLFLWNDPVSVSFQKKQISIIVVNGSSSSSVLRLSLENQPAAARAAPSDGTSRRVPYYKQTGKARGLSDCYHTAGPSYASASRTKHLGRRKQKGKEERRRRRRETAAVGECRSSSILMCANSPAPAD